MIPDDYLSAIARDMFDAYNAAGPNPGKTWDGKDVPAWPDLGDAVRTKWLAAARAVVSECETWL